MRKRLKSRTILFGTCFYDERVHRGILRYARTSGWKVKLLQDHAWEHHEGTAADGVISLMTGEEEQSGMTEYLLSLKLPTVDLGMARLERNIPRVLPDLLGAGRLAGEHFRLLGQRDWLHVCWGVSWHDDLRIRGFSEMAERCNANLRILKLNVRRASAMEAIRDCLDELPKPVAVFCSFDDYASQVLDACFERDWRVPYDVAILGCYNHELHSAFAEMPISTIDLDMETRGYRAAAMLDGLLRGEPPPASPVYSPVGGLVERTTTRFTALADGVVAEALAFIANSLHRPLSVTDVMRAAGLSRAALQRRFEGALGHGVATEINRLKIERAGKLLRETEESASAIGEQVGFPDTLHFYRVFKRHTGMTTKEYRRVRRRG